MKMSLLTLGCLIASAVLPLSLSAANRAVGTGPDFKGPVGLQLYSLRDQFKTDVPGTLARVRDYGFKYVELAGTYGLAPKEFRNLLKQHKLEPVAGHFPFEQYRDNLDSAVRDAKALGLKYAGCAWIPHQGDFDEKTCREAIAVFNRAGKALSKEGIKFFYHVHGYEFQPYGKGTLFDLLMDETDRKSVCYEMDILWVYFPGQDPVKLLEKYGKRWELLHLKDLKRGVQTGSLSGQTDVRNDVVLGTGQIPLPEILKAARKAGTKYYFIEDESPSAPEQIPQSLTYLEHITW